VSAECFVEAAPPPRARASFLPDGNRLHLHDRPIDLIVDADGSEVAVKLPFARRCIGSGLIVWEQPRGRKVRRASVERLNELYWFKVPSHRRTDKKRSGVMANYNEESVLSVRHWTDNLFSFTTTRDPSFRFRNGEFVMMRLEIDRKPLLRAYSVASANYEPNLEFFSIKVQDGPLTSRLQHLKEGDRVLVGRKATGTLVADNLKQGRNLYLIGTGTGLAPFLSVIKDPETYERFEKVVLVHGCRQVAELAYGEMITETLPRDELIGEFIEQQLVYYPTVTRDPFHNRGRITDLISSGKLFSDIGQPTLEAELDRVMICGSPALVADMKAILLREEFVEGNHGEPGDFVVEKAFVER
jgi:ferredoxin--NADP+ reductase